MTTTGGGGGADGCGPGGEWPRRHSLNPAAGEHANSSDAFLRRASVGGVGGSLHPSQQQHPPPPPVGSDDSVEQTNEDAAACKRSAVRFGYWRDPYIQHLSPRVTERKAPEIHLGYFTRVVGLRRLLDTAMERCTKQQGSNSGGVQVGRGDANAEKRCKKCTCSM